MTTQNPQNVWGGGVRWYLSQTSMRLKLFLGRKGNTNGSTDRKTKKKAVLKSCRQQQKGEALFLQLYLGQHHPLSLWRADTMEHLGLVWTLECSGCLFKLSVPIKAAAPFESLQREQQQTTISQVSLGVNTIKPVVFQKCKWMGKKWGWGGIHLQKSHIWVRIIITRKKIQKMSTWCWVSWIGLSQTAKIDFYSWLLRGLPRGSLTAHIASPWNIDESFPVALLMQQLLWAVINRMFPFRLERASVSTRSSP